jgi:ABC-2 type transport system ATP-binding protein
MLELRNVSKHFSGIPAVDNVSFSARPGEVTGYLGPNGSGKSTTMKMITGLIEMTDGQILFQGKPIQDDLISYKRVMGYVSGSSISGEQNPPSSISRNEPRR